MDLKEEKELVAKARRDPVFFGQIYEEYYPKIFRYALRRIGDVRIAEDITSETFVKAINNFNKFKWVNVSFSAWIYKIATNEINYYFRKGKYKHYSLELLSENGFEPAAQTDFEAELEDLEAQLQLHKDFLQIQKELKKLPVKYQQVIALRYFENKKVSEIAEILGKKEGTVKSLLSRGLDLIRNKLPESQAECGMQPFSDSSIVYGERQENNINPARERNP